MKTIYPNQELYTWTPEWDVSISKVAPTSYNIEQVNGNLVQYTSGLPYAGWLAKRVIDILPVVKLSFFTLQLNLTPDFVAARKAQAYEMDMMVSDETGHVYNLSNLIDMSKNGMWCVADSEGNWRETGISIYCNAGEINSYEFMHCVDPVTKTSYPVSINNLGPKPPMLAIPNFNLKWEPNLAVLQIQPGLNNLGGAYSQTSKNINLEIVW